MIVKVREDKFDFDKSEFIRTNEYDLNISDEKIVDKITTETPTYWYALIDGKLFKSDQEKGIKGIYFATKESLEEHLADALYWRKGLVPRIGQGVGYDTDDFYKKLIETHNVEFKQVKF